MFAGCPEGLLDETDGLDDDDERDVLDDERDKFDDERDEFDEERDTDEERDEDDDLEPPRDCASRSNWKAANANPISIAAKVLADNLIVLEFSETDEVLENQKTVIQFLRLINVVLL